MADHPPSLLFPMPTNRFRADADTAIAIVADEEQRLIAERGLLIDFQ